MEEGLIRKLTEEMASVTKETGNTVSIPKGRSLAVAFLEMIKTTQAGVDRDGNVSRPTLFLNDPVIELDRVVVDKGVAAPSFLPFLEAAVQLSGKFAHAMAGRFVPQKSQHLLAAKALYPVMHPLWIQRRQALWPGKPHAGCLFAFTRRPVIRQSHRAADGFMGG